MFNENRDEFKFEWDHLGDINLGRPNLGTTTHVAVYRLMQFTLRDALIKHTDPDTARRIFYDAGYVSGQAIYENLLAPVDDFSDLVSGMTRIFRELQIGILRLEQSDTRRLNFVLTVAEDLDCSGLPLHEEAVCTYDEGLLAGIFHAHSGAPFEVKEVDCWALGDRTCRFQARPAVS